MPTNRKSKIEKLREQNRKMPKKANAGRALFDRAKQLSLKIDRTSQENGFLKWVYDRLADGKSLKSEWNKLGAAIQNRWVRIADMEMMTNRSLEREKLQAF